MQQQPNPVFNIPQHRVNIKYYDSGSILIQGRTSLGGVDCQELNVHFAKVVNVSGMWSC